MSTNAQGLNSLATIIKRLEAATSRLEDIALAQGSASNVKQGLDAPSTHPPPAPRAPSAPGASAPASAPAEDSQSVKAFDELIITGKLEPFLKLAGDIGGPVKEQSDLVGNLFRGLRDLIQCAAVSAKPSDAAFMTMLGPLQADITAVNSIKDKYRKERDFGNHFSTLSEGVPAVGWVTISPKPAPYVGDMRDSATFYANRILKDFKDKDQKHVQWARAFLELLDELKKYVIEHHTTGLAWNPQGGDATQFKSASVTPAAGGPPPPPPPPPPAGVPPPPPPPAAAASTAAPAAPDASAVFAQINQGADITKGLRKVNKEEMTHKNPALRASGTVPTAPGPGPRRPSKPAKPASLQTKKPPKMELSGNKWSIENYEDDSSVIVENTELSHVVNVFNCKNTTIQIKGKINGVVLCNAISVVNCKKTSVLIESLVASLSITSSPSFTVQITGVTPTIQIDNSDSGQIYLSKECLGVEIITAKCSAINVSIPEEGEEDGVFVERAVPEMLRTTVQNGKLVTNIVEHSG
ncbi:adenylate cyclase associated N terminal-domain-containing protein [Rhizoctonia solani]|nr:adenylate cyclase associated N terminal-domain-containing protein [Rhizoctonia solani]